MEKINYKNQITFGAKFLNTDAINKVAKYALENGKFEKLNNARKNIESYDYFSKIGVEIKENLKSGQKEFEFTTYTPEYTVKSGKLLTQYKIHKNKFPSQKANYLKEIYEIIIKMGNSAPQNKLYKKIVKG